MEDDRAMEIPSAACPGDDGLTGSVSGRPLRQAVHEDVEQQLEALTGLDRREVPGQGGEVGELPGWQRGEVAARVILGQLRRTAVVPVRARLLCAAAIFTCCRLSA